MGQKRYPPGKKHKKHHRMRRKTAKRILAFFTAVLIIAAALAALWFIFRLKTIDVAGNTYTSSSEVQAWVKKDPRCGNTLYAYWKLNKGTMAQLPSVESAKAAIKSPFRIQVQVKEKTLEGRVDFDGGYLYFDQKGIACLKSDEALDGVPSVEGLTIESNKVKMGKALPVTDQRVFSAITEMTDVLQKYKLTPDKISCNDTELTLEFGNVRAQMGSSDFDIRGAQLSAILQKLNEVYPGQAGVLHLENFHSTEDSIRFVPES